MLVVGKHISERDPSTEYRREYVEQGSGNKDAGAPQADNDASLSHVVSVFGKTLASDYLGAINSNAADTGLMIGTFGLYLPYKVGSAVIKGAKAGGPLGALKAYLRVLPLPLVGDLIALDTLHSATDWKKATPAERAETVAHAVLPAAAAVATVVGAVKGTSGGPRPEGRYLRGGKHGIAWKEGLALAKDGGPQGQWGSAADLAYAGVKAAMLKPGEGDSFALPKGHTSVVHRPDGTTVPANNFWVRNNGTGTFHGYPTE